MRLMVSVNLGISALFFVVDVPLLPLLLLLASVTFFAGGGGLARGCRNIPPGSGVDHLVVVEEWDCEAQ